MPGVTIANARPHASRMSANLLRRRDDAVEPGAPASARPAAAPGPATGVPMPTPASAASSRLVSTVTAMTSGGGRRPRGPLHRPRPPCAARIIAAPPDAWTFTIQTPSRVAAATAPATVFGMSWNFRSRNTRSPRADQLLDEGGPVAREEAAADLEAADHAAQPVREGDAPRRPCRRRERRAADSCVYLRLRCVEATVPTRSRDAWRSGGASGSRRCPSRSFAQMNGSTKLAVPTWTAVAPAIMNSSASRASAMPPMPMIGNLHGLPALVAPSGRRSAGWPVRSGRRRRSRASAAASRRRSTMARNVLTSDTASAPASSAARANDATSVTFGVSFGMIGSVVTLRTALTTSRVPIEAAAELDAAFLDVRARDVQLDAGDALGVRQDARDLDVLVERGAADVDDDRGAPRAQFGQLLVDEAVHADALQADRVQHPGRRFDDARRRVAFAFGEEQSLRRRRRRATTGRRARRTRRRSRSSRSPR